MNRYYANKLGLINFWYYDIEEFDLASGKLLLRGSNGSGKSVTMQSFIPLILDGNKAPERIDPFGTKARTIGNYLLMTEEDTEKTAYIYMEFKEDCSDTYITIGMGMKAVKNKPLQSWYFILNDGRRINKDIFLYRDAGGYIPLTKKQLENALGGSGFFTDSQKSYMEAVNKALFGFDNIEAYEELLNLLISVRSPKLSKDFKPTEIYKILTDSLKVLSDEDLRPMSEVMENMDSHQEKLEDNQRALKAAKNVNYHYDKYNKKVLAEKCTTLIKADTMIKTTEKQIEEKNKELKRLEQEKVIKENCKQEKNNEFKLAEEKYEKLINREEFKLKKELEEIKKDLNDSEKTLNKNKAALQKKKEKGEEVKQTLKTYEADIEKLDVNVKGYIKELEDFAEEMQFQQGIGLSSYEVEDISKEDIDNLGKLVKEFEIKIREAEREMLNYEIQKQKVEEIVHDLDKATLELTKEESKMRTSEELFSTEKDDYKVYINKLSNENILFLLEEEEKLNLFKTVEGIEDLESLYEVTNYLSECLNKRINVLKGYTEFENKIIEDLNNEILNIRHDIEELKYKKDIEPQRSEAVIKNRERLKEKGINFLPLYKAIDFNKHVTDNVKENIEAALYNMGLLDALIINPRDREEALKFEADMEDKYIFSEPNIMSYNLSNLLKVDSELKEDKLYNEIFDVLQSIFLDATGANYISENGAYKIGIIGGKAEEGRKQCFIGEASRKRHRETLIKEKENLILVYEENIVKHKNSIGLYEKDINILNSEFHKSPTTDGIATALKLIKETEENMKRIEETITQLKDKKHVEADVLNNIKLSILKKLSGYEYIKTIEQLREVQEIIVDYKEGLTSLGSSILILAEKKQSYKSRQEEYGDILHDIDNLNSDSDLIEKKILKFNIKQTSINEVLAKVDLAEIEDEINFCIKVKDENPGIIEELVRSITSIESTTQNIIEFLEELNQKLQVARKEYMIFEEILMEEYSLEYVVPKIAGDLMKLCNEILQDIGSNDKENREHYADKLNEAISRNAGELREYNLRFSILFNDEDGEQRHLRQRKNLIGNIHGKRDVNFNTLIEEIQKSIEELELLISEEERKIFEEILMNTISQKVQAKIYQSTNWVKKINKLMNSMDTSSSLKLSLSWEPKKAESEGELDIARVIEILNRGDRNKNEDLKKLSSHFSQKVKNELRSYEGSGEVRNYHSIIKDVLDYRKWYEFKLSFTKTNERKRELTNNAFFQFSGGEKAMSMYIPLFSAIYARYENARSSCPRIISMDEAFAGVDENNIRDMFRLLKQLDLQYILNSQILWGCYDTVDELAICELLREENDDVVSILRYHWNGKEKMLIS